MAPTALASAGYFRPAAVAELVNKMRTAPRASETDEMALAGIVSTQLWHEQFIRRRAIPPPLSDQTDVKVCDGRSTTGAP